MGHASTMRRLYELISARDIDGFGDHVAEDFVEHEETPGFERSKRGVTEMFRMYRAAFPDLRMAAEDVLVSGDKVVARVAQEHWGVFDALAMMQQLGAIPAGARS